MDVAQSQWPTPPSHIPHTAAGRQPPPPLLPQPSPLFLPFILWFILFSFVFSTFSLLVNSPKVKVYTPKEDMKFAFWKTITVNPSWILQVKDLFLSSVVLQRVWILSAEVFRHLRLIPQPLFQHKGDRWNFVFVVKRKKENISEIIISASLVRYDHRSCIPVAGLQQRISL